MHETAVTTIPAPTGRPAYTQDLPRRPQSAAEARRLVRLALGAWGLEELADTCALVVSELVGNAVRHTRSRTLRLAVTRPEPGAVRIAVTDTSHARPVRAEPGAEDLRGRGLLLVEALCVDWGTDELPYGKRVWAECTTPTRPTTAA
jgi:anti-sigma regulatory factor (Ser/Thr protein kinase)